MNLLMEYAEKLGILEAKLWLLIQENKRLMKEKEKIEKEKEKTILSLRDKIAELETKVSSLETLNRLKGKSESDSPSLSSSELISEEDMREYLDEEFNS